MASYAQCFLIATTVSVSLAVCLPATAKDAPQLTSSLAKNLWRQCHTYFEEGMDAKAKRACGELQSWAQENDEPAIAREAADMVAALDAREQSTTSGQSTREEKGTRLQTTDPGCGYGSADAIPFHVVNKSVTATPGEFLNCRHDQDCVAARNLCGTSKAVNKHSQTCYEAMVRRFDQNAGCAAGESSPATAVCRDGTCLLQY